MSESKSAKRKSKTTKPVDEDMDIDDEPRLSDHLEAQRRMVFCGPEMNYHVNTVTSALTYMSCGVDNSWDHAAWARDLLIHVTSVSDGAMEFEIAGLDPSLANALRRCLIGDVPTVAIEHVFVVDNTSIMQEEVLAHRLGLVPLAFDPELLEDRVPPAVAAESNTLVFKLCKRCTKAANHTAAEPAYVDSNVYSSDLQWRREGSEYPDETGTRFVEPQPESWAARPVHPDILLCKLRPGQTIELEAHAIRGTGAEHAKWSPVATAWYRMYPEVVELKAVTGQLALDLASEVPDVFSTEAVDVAGVETAKLRIANVRDHDGVLEKIRHMTGLDKYKDHIQVRKRKEHFIFTVESVGSIPPAQVFVRALDILSAKCDRLERAL